MTLTSLTIDGTEYISKLQYDGTAINQELGGAIATANFRLHDTVANINAITMQDEVIAYVGSTKVFGGYLAYMNKRKLNSTTMAADLRCQDYSVLLEEADVTTEETYSGTDEAALDDLCSSYCSSISTTPVQSVESDMKGTVIPIGESVRKAVERITDRTGAVSYVNASKGLEYFDPATDPEAVAFYLRESPDITTETEDFDAFWTKTNASYSSVTQKLTEDSTAAVQHYMVDTSGPTITNGEEYVIWADIKAAGRTWANIETNLSGAFRGASFNLSTGATGTVDSPLSARMVEIDDGWFRCYVWVTSGTTTPTSGIYIASADDTITYNGNGTDGILVRKYYFGDGHPFLRETFRHDIDAATLANDITVIDTASPRSTTVDWSVGDSPSDAEVGALGASWPPTVNNQNELGTEPSIKSGYETSQYVDYQLFLKWDTSSIPDAATITSATLKLWVAGYIYTAAGNARMEGSWYDASNWPITTADYARFTAAGDAIVSQSYSGWTDEEWREYSLSSPDANISKTGETGIKLGTRWTSSPTAAPNYIFAAFAAFDSTSKPAPILEVTYQVGGYSANAADATSKSTYRAIFETISDSSIASDAEAQLRADVELAKRKDPLEYGTLQVRYDGIRLGDLLHIESTSHDLDGDFLVRSITTAWPSGICTHTIDFGDHKPDAVKLVRQLAALRDAQL